MKSVFSGLFGTRTQPRRNSKKPVHRNATLGVEVLDERILMSVTPTLSNGQLALVSNGGNDNITVSTSTTTVLENFGLFSLPESVTNVNVSANFADGSTSKTYNASSVSSLLFQAGGGADVFTNNTGINSVFHGETGTVTMNGGTGQNTYFVNGNDTINPGGTQNVTYGLLNNLTPNELAAQGTLGAALSADNKTLTLSGPSGAGFNLAGNWTDTQTSSQEIFKATGTVIMESALGNIPLPTGPIGVTVTTTADGVSGSGPVTSVNLTGLPNLSVNNSGPLQTLSNELGLTITLPNLSWGLDLGSNLGSTGLPLNAGVPYLYVSVNTGVSVSFGNFNLSSDSGKSLAIAIDPSDPSLVASYGSFTVGGSLKGYIPFTPVSQPSAISNTLYGNIYGSAQGVQIGDYPVSLSGSIDINLDANHTGHPLGISGSMLSDVLDGSKSISSLASTALNDIAFGVNGTVSLGYDKDGFTLSVPVGNATLMYEPAVDSSSPGILAFNGSQPNLFAGTPLDNLIPTALQNAVTPPRYFVDGSIAWDGGVQDWHLTAGVDNLVLGGSFTATQAQITIDNAGVHANASISGLLGLASINVSGDINSDGSFDLHASGSAGLSAGKITTLHAGFGFDLTHTAGSGSTSLTATVNGSFDSFDVLGGSVSGSASGSVTITATYSAFFKTTLIGIGGSATASLTYSHGSSNDVYTIGFSFNNSGFTIDTPWFMPNITVGWNGVVFDDLNGNGVRDPGDPGLSGYTVFLDLNDSGRYQPGDPVAVTNATGAYSFGQLPDVPFIARVILPNGNVALTNPFDNDVFNPASGENMQYHFGIKAVNPAGQAQLATTLRNQLFHQTAVIGFWGSKNGQTLINSLNGGSSSTQLSSWLAATFPNLYGANAGTHNLTGMSNAQVAQFFLQLETKGQTLDEQVLATALSVYVTDSSLAGTAAAAYGFQIIGGGAGTMGFNVTTAGAAAGAANNSVMTILNILLATDALSLGANGTLYGSNIKLRAQAAALYGAINLAGKL